jgi:putative membrane protein
MSSGKGREILRFIARVLVIWFIQVVALFVMAWLLGGVQVAGVGTAIAAVGLIALLNALLWPLLSYVLLPFAVLTLGRLSLILNGAFILLASNLVDGFQVDSLGWAILLAMGLTAITTILSSLFTIDDDNSWQRNMLRRRVRRQQNVVETDEPGFLFLELDGLAKPVLERAMAEGRMPTLARWLETGSHRLVGWETDMSSQTSASQAGILHGSNHNIPAFRWYDRKSKKIVASSSPRFVADLENDLSDGNGLLAADGASRGNLFSGDAPDVMNTASTILDRSRFHTADFQSYFLDPYNFTRTLLLAIWDIMLEMWQFRKARRNNVYPISDKKKRGGIYPLMRVFMTVVMRDLNLNTLVGDMYAGVPAVYATFVGYDEVAHHSGVEAEDALDILHKLDRHLARLERVAKGAPRPYHIVVLSDHGQTGGATFKQRYGMTLEDLVRQMAREKSQVQGDVDVHEDWSYVNSMLTEAVRFDRGMVAKPLGRALEGRSREGHVSLGPEGMAQVRESKVVEEPGEGEEWEPGSTIVVLASGNLGLVYGTQTPERATLEQIEAFYPGLLDGLAQHEGIGFLLVHSEADGPVVIGAGGRAYLRDGLVEGEDPLANFGPNAARHLRRNDAFPDAPDIYVSSFYDPETGEGAAFEEQIGFHGGLGGTQTQPFVLAPSELLLSEEPLIGAEAVYRLLKSWVSPAGSLKDITGTITKI